MGPPPTAPAAAQPLTPTSLPRDSSRLFAALPDWWFPASRKWRLAAALAVAIALLPLAKPVWPALFGTVESWIRSRSALDLKDDFTAGLSGWSGAPGWNADWAFDPAGSVRPGQLALLRASLPLSDYRLELSGQIQKKSLGWVFRASSVQNYYAMKITITKPGPLPQASIVRYAVVHGTAVDRVESPLRMDLREDTIYHVQTSAYGDRFVTWVNGRIVDAFSDQRHPSGGVGLFGGPGEASHIVSVRVADQDDLLGRACAWFFQLFPRKE